MIFRDISIFREYYSGMKLPFPITSLFLTILTIVCSGSLALPRAAVGQDDASRTVTDKPFYRYQKLASAVLQTRDIEDGWDGIQVLTSTRADVERKFGKPVNDDYGVHYRTTNAWINVIYSGEPCSGIRTNGEYRVPKETVLSYSVVPTTRLKLDDLDWKKGRFTKYPEVHRARASYYISLDRATMITTIEDSDGTEIVESIDYQVTKETGAKWKCEKTVDK